MLGGERFLDILLHDFDDGQKFLGFRSKLKFPHNLLFVAMAADAVMHELQRDVIGQLVTMRFRYNMQQQVDRRCPAGTGVSIPVYFKDAAREDNLGIAFLEAYRPFPMNGTTIPVQQSGRCQDESARAKRANLGAMLYNPAKLRE